MAQADPQQSNADQLAFWNGAGGDTWVARQQHTDITLAPVSEALLALAAPTLGERVLDVGCGCGATTLDLVRAVGPTGRVAAMLAEGRSRRGCRYRQCGVARGRPRHGGAGPLRSAGLPAEVVTAAKASIREALAAYVEGASVRLPAAMWLVSSALA
jgi:SAM-dependent methyltransferase